MQNISDNYSILRLKLKELSTERSFQYINPKSREEQVEHLYYQMQQIVNVAGIKAVDILTDMGKLLTVMESPCLLIAPGLSPLLASHYNLCLGTIISLAGDKISELQEYIDDLETLKTKGIYMVTELDRGNNVMGLQTQAYFDEELQQFIINTPVAGACKFMPYLSSDHQPKLAVVMARLWLKEKEYGVHPFIVRCRDQNGKLLRGIKVSKLSTVDMYSSEADHSVTSFDNVRVPRHAFLGGDLNEVTTEGHFLTKNTSKRDIFFNSLCRVEWGKLVLVAALMSHYKMAIAVAIEYSKKRKVNGKNTEFKLSDIATHKLDLANAYVALTASIALYEDTKQRCLTVEQTHEELQHEAAVVKAMCVEIARGALNTCMARAGAHGKMIRNRIAQAVILNDHTATAEGDSLPVLMKIAKDLISRNLVPEQLYDIQTISITTQQALLKLLLSQINLLSQQIREKLDTDENQSLAWNNSTHIAKELAWAYGIYKTAITLRSRSNVQRSFCINHILSNAAWFSANQLVTGEEFQKLRECYEEICIDIFDKEAISVAEEFDIVDLVKMTPIGSDDNALKWMELSRF